jgi:lysophospholipase L1-like esterase
MKAKLSVLVAALVVLLWLSAPAFAGSPAASDADAVHYYVSLGDSLAAGPQAGGDANNYADQLFAALRKHDPTLQLVKLGCGGETTHSMIFRNPCGYSHGSQLDEAVAFLHAHTQFVRLVTIDIGANDVFLCVLHLDQGCLDTALPSVTTNLAAILAAVHDAAGPDVPIVGANYYDPFLAFWFSSPGAAQLTEQMVVQFNDALESARGPALADVESAFETTNWTDVGGVPQNVLRICQWTQMCTNSPDVHPNTAGYGVIAQAFLDVLP